MKKTYKTDIKMKNIQNCRLRSESSQTTMMKNTENNKTMTDVGNK